MTTLTHSRLLEAIRYEPKTGKCFWLIRGAHRRMPGDEAGSPSKDKRIRIRIDGTLYYRYRLAWFYMTGSWPAKNVDHLNGDATDDSWGNLRDVSQVVNIQNRHGAQSNNRSGLLGAHSAHGGKFTSSIWINKRKRHLGTFDTAEQAHTEYMKARRELQPGNTL
jgi:hypothetical protein